MDPLISPRSRRAVGAGGTDQTGTLSDPKPARDAEADLAAVPAGDRHEWPALQHYAPDAVDGALRMRVEAARIRGVAASEEPDDGQPPLFDRSSRRMAAVVLVLLVAIVALVIVPLHQELGF